MENKISTMRDVPKDRRIKQIANSFEKWKSPTAIVWEWIKWDGTRNRHHEQINILCHIVNERFKDTQFKQLTPHINWIVFTISVFSILFFIIKINISSERTWENIEIRMKNTEIQLLVSRVIITLLFLQILYIYE